MSKLRVGDTVLWQGCFGNDNAQEVVVESLEVTEYPREKYGEPVDEVDWEDVNNNLVVFTLNNGSWAYSDQITPRK